MLHGARLEEELLRSSSGPRTMVLAALKRQPVALSDFDVVRRLQYDPVGDARAACANTLWIFGSIAEDVLLRLMQEEWTDSQYDVGAAAATSLMLIGGESAILPLESVATLEVSGVWRSVRKKAARQALLAIEARLGCVQGRPPRPGLWGWEPLKKNQMQEPIAGYWRLAHRNELHGGRIGRLIDEATAVWPLKQLLEATLDQETHVEDLPYLLRLVHDPRAPRIGAVPRLWRYGVTTEPMFIELLESDDFGLALSACRSLDRIGTSSSLPSLRSHAEVIGSPLATTGVAFKAIAAIEARQRTPL